ncbi:MAG: protein NO VEIN domain-containing protein [bacterium]
MSINRSFEKIVFVKTGWADYYSGDPIIGRHDYIGKFNDAHEKFNFLQAPDKKYYASIPPIGENYSVPQPVDKEGWLIIFVSAYEGKGRLVAVGYYLNARFESQLQFRPEYELQNPFETDVQGNKYSYCITSDEAYLIPKSERNFEVDGKHFRRSPIIYARGVNKDGNWRNEYASLAEQIYGHYSTKEIPNNSGEPSLRFPDQEHRKKVEKASVDFVKKNLKVLGYVIEDKQKLKCGYDLLAKRDMESSELHIEVKGTSGTEPHFYLSKNEKNYIPNPKWRLAIVINALNNPSYELLTKEQLDKRFHLIPIAWESAVRM